MQRRAFVRSSLAAAVLAPGAFSLPELARIAPAAPPHRRVRADPVRLSSNENPLGMPESARRAIVDALPEGNRYPQRNGDMVARIAGKHGITPENVTLGNGSAEILQMTVQAMAAGGRDVRVVIPDPTFEQVERYAAAMRAGVVKVPLRPDHTHDLQRMQELAAGSRGPALAFICNPNNPTGTLTSCDAISQWIRTAPENVWFLVDEAYFEFVDDPAYRTFIPEATARPNVIVSRTFSKIYGLAGVRLGYGVGHPETIGRVDLFRAGTNINQFALAAGLACLDDDAFIRRSLDVNAQGRRFAYRTLGELGLEHLPSHTNFVMHRINGDLQRYISRLREEGISVGRPFPPMVTYNRVSIGLPQEMEAWADALRKLRRQGWV